MVLVLQVVSSHLLGVAGIESALCAQACLTNRLLPHAANEAEAVNRVNFRRLFLLDGCSITFPLGPLSSHLRANSPGSPIPGATRSRPNWRSRNASALSLGIDGMLVLDAN